MLSPIDGNHPIFSGEAYRKDVVPFDLIEVLRLTAPLLVSDGESVVVCSSQNPAYPSWVWTAEGIGEDALRDLYAWLFAKLTGVNSAYFVAKPPVASALADLYVREKGARIRRIHMESFECPLLIPAKNTTVTPEGARPEDRELLAEYARYYTKDCFGTEMTEKDSLEAADAFLACPLGFVIRIDGRPVAMAKCSRETATHAAVNEVYTLPEYRCRGYAAALVAHISSLILKSGKVPLLYTDLSNPASNKAYTGVGFVPRGRVDEILLEWD